jgi:ABC-type bacteriocin/lantibiotic exporter with double-glycine peptidase domain
MHLLLTLLVPLYVMAPTDSIVRDRTGQAQLSPAPVRAESTSSIVRESHSAALDVPIITQARERCGQAALAMVLRYYGAAPAALREVDAAYDPALRGSLITDLARAARRAGYDAAVETLTPDGLIALLDDGVPPILLYQNGTGPITVRHYGVVTRWDAAGASFTVNDGSAHPRVATRGDLAKRWQTAGSQALIVRPVMR